MTNMVMIIDLQNLLYLLILSAALVAISSLYLGLPNDILPGLNYLDVLDYVPGNMEDTGLDYMVTSARRGDVHSMIFLAKAFDSGLNLGTARMQSYKEAMDWYEMAIEVGVDKRYLIIARMAAIMLMDDSGMNCFYPQLN